MTLAVRYQSVLGRIRALDPKSRVTLIAVSKTQAFEAIQGLYALGQRDFGENYVQELVGKAQQAHDAGLADIRWHFIGHLQTNKVKAVLPWLHALHSLDSEKLALEVSKRWTALGRPGRLPVFVEVNISKAATKSGLDPGQIEDLLARLKTLSGLDVRGLMAIPEPGRTEEGFRALAALGKGLPELSMGMSEDFEAAIRCGSTAVRVGTALFGPRH